MPYKNILYKRFNIGLPLWSVVAPLAAVLVFMLGSGTPSGLWAAAVGVAVIMSVLGAVHHAEVVAHRVGEPFGTLILAVAITIIEVSLIVSIMLTENKQESPLARDTVFAAIMIILTGIIGLCLLIGGLRHKEQVYMKQGVSASLVSLTAISFLTMVLPNYTTSIGGAIYSSTQLIFVAVICLVVYLAFVFVQAVRHRDYFLPERRAQKEDPEEVHADPPNNSTTVTSLLFLVIALAMVVLLSKKLSPVIEEMVVNIGAPKSLVGIIIATVILLPEGMAALRAARNDRLQTSLNLALGSALACVGLTIPAVAIVSQLTGYSVALGLDAKSTMLMSLSLFIVSLSFSAGRTNILQGIVLLMIFITYLFTTIFP